MATAVVDVSAPAVALTPVVASKQSRIDAYNLTTYIHRIEKEIYSNINVSKEVIETVNDLLLDVLEKIVKASDSIAIYGDVITLGVREIQTAVNTILPNEILKEAVKAAVEACNTYDTKILNPPKRGKGKVESSVAQNGSDSPNASKKPGASRSDRADITLPISRIETVIRKTPKTKITRVSEGAPIYIAAVLDYLARRLLTAAGKVTQGIKIHLMKMTHLVEAIEKDIGLREMYAGWLLMNKELVVENEVVAPQSQSPAGN
jgi:histone H3/H4